MTSKNASVTFDRDKQAERDNRDMRDMGGVGGGYSLRKKGIDIDGGRDSVTVPMSRSVTKQRDRTSVTGDGDERRPCHQCQVGQGRNCACLQHAQHKSRRSLWDMSAATFWRGYVLGLVLCWAVGYWSAS